MQSDVVVLMMSNLLFSIWIAPFVVTIATVIRTALLLTGKRRTFRSWTRNAILSVVTIIFAPGMVINTGVRYAVAALFRIDIEGVGAGSTYAELNLFLKVDKPPRVWVLICALFVSTVLSVFIGFSLLVLPVILLLGAPVVLLSWYLALGVLFNCCIRGGDVSLLSAALKGQPRRGSFELLLVLIILVLFYIQLAGVVA